MSPLAQGFPQFDSVSLHVCELSAGQQEGALQLVIQPHSVSVALLWGSSKFPVPWVRSARSAAAASFLPSEETRITTGLDLSVSSLVTESFSVCMSRLNE